MCFSDQIFEALNQDSKGSSRKRITSQKCDKKCNKATRSQNDSQPHHTMRHQHQSRGELSRKTGLLHTGLIALQGCGWHSGSSRETKNQQEKIKAKYITLLEKGLEYYYRMLEFEHPFFLGVKNGFELYSSTPSNVHKSEIWNIQRQIGLVICQKCTCSVHKTWIE